MRKASKSRAAWTSEEETEEVVKETDAPDAFPLRAGLRKALSQPNGRRRTNPSNSGADNNTFPALLTVWAAGTLLFKKRGNGHNIGTSGEASDGLPVNPGVGADVLSKIAELDAQVKALQSQQLLQQLQQQRGEEKDVHQVQSKREEQQQLLLLQQDARFQALAQQQDAKLLAWAQQQDAKLATLGQQKDAKLATLGQQHDAELSALEQQQVAKLAALGQQRDAELSALEQQQDAKLSALEEQQARQQQQQEADREQAHQHALSLQQLSAQMAAQQEADQEQAHQPAQFLQQLSAQMAAQQEAHQEQAHQHALTLQQLKAQVAAQQQQWEAELQQVQQQQAGKLCKIQQQLDEQRVQYQQQAGDLHKMRQQLDEQRAQHQQQAGELCKIQPQLEEQRMQHQQQLEQQQAQHQQQLGQQQAQHQQQLEEQQAQHQQQLEEQKAQNKQLLKQMKGMRRAEHQQRGAMILGGDPRGQLDLMAVRTMVALGIDLTKPKYRPGLETSVSTLIQLGSGPVPGASGTPSPHVTTPTKGGTPAKTPPGNPVSKKHQPGLVAATTILSSLAMLLGEAGHECSDERPGMEAGSHALAALCCDTLSTAKDTDFQVHIQALSRAAGAVAEKGIEPHDPVHKPGMLAAASILAALGGIKPSSEQHQQQQQQQGEEEDEADGLFFSDQAATVDALIELSTYPVKTKAGQQGEEAQAGAGSQQAVSAREMLANRLIGNVGGTFKPPKPDTLPTRDEPAGEHQADTNGNNAEDATLRACAAQITALEAQMAESHAQLACALKALGIGQDAAVKDPEAAALKATVAADAAQCKELAHQHAEMSEHVGGIQSQIKEIEAGLTVALMALKIDKENAAHDPEAAAAAANLLSNGMLFMELSEKLKELSEQQDKKHEHTKVVTSSQLVGLEKQVEELQGKVLKDPSSTQLADLQRQIDVALDALGIDKAEVLDDPETAALGATTNTNMAQLQELSRRVDNLQVQADASLSKQGGQPPGSLSRKVDNLQALADQSPSGEGQEKYGGCKDAAAVKESLNYVNARLDSLERKSAVSAVDVPGASKGVRPTDLKALEAHLLDRLEEQAKSTEQLGRVIEVIVADANKLASLHGLSTAPQTPEAITTYYFQPFTFTSVFQKYITYDDILEKFAQNKNMKDVATKARSDTEGCLMAMKEMDIKYDSKNEAVNQVLIKIAGQVDFLHAKIRDVAAGKTDKATRESSLPPLARTSSGKPSLLSMGTLGRSKTLKGLLGLHDERGESTAQRALQEYETEELKRRDSGGSSSLATTSKRSGWDLLAKYKASKKTGDKGGTSKA
eukprot:CAMPEP_0202392198 /NCGR_PEP_ID=MMETSP1127-20130417/92248_1 /ASSEMBLY_ACC=CAM_ASM_000462 /TAXON_ID=3047 /ORGANISM="Dunaliella tertiolecta, Strain CCMP1320" /LENGTH=1311 /DNA_ID=CAMNT_0048994693 /DNA_START=82 /DNA_END=4017 /DNA_ORIENTATION=+